jgi:two-component system phosphate regulon response regulator OmpR
MGGQVVGQPRVVVIEDDDDARAFLEDLFLSEGYLVRSARDADEARAAIAEHSPHLLVIDIMLPRETGLSLYRGLRDAGNAVRAIFITARPSDLPRIYARELGASDFFRKPFDADALLRSAARALGVLPRSGRSAA